MCCCFSCCAGSSFCAAIFCTVQSFLWAVVAIIGAVTYTTCNVDPQSTYFPGEELVTTWYDMYFKNKDCKPNYMNLNSTSEYDEYLQTQNTTSLVSPEETYKITTSYSVISCLWFVSCILLMIGLKRTNDRKSCVVIWFIPFIIFTSASILLDAIAGISYGVDIGEILTTLGEDTANPVHAYMIAAAACMCVFSLRGGIIWIINVVCLLCVICSTFCAGCKQSKPKTPKAPAANPQRQNQPRQNYQPQSRPQPEPRPQPQPQNVAHSNQPFSLHEQEQLPSQNRLNLHYSPQHLDSKQEMFPYKVHPSSQDGERNYQYPPVDYHTQKSPRFFAQAGSPSYNDEMRIQGLLRYDNDNNPRNSQLSSDDYGSLQRQSSARASVLSQSKNAPKELRNQFPWSYMNPRKDLVKRMPAQDNPVFTIDEVDSPTNSLPRATLGGHR